MVSSPRWAVGALHQHTGCAEGLDGSGVSEGFAARPGGSSQLNWRWQGWQTKLPWCWGRRGRLSRARFCLCTTLALSAWRARPGLPGLLQPPRLARLLQQRSPRRQRGVVQGPGLRRAGASSLRGETRSQSGLTDRGECWHLPFVPAPSSRFSLCSEGAPNAFLVGTSPSSRPPPRCLLGPRL